MGRTRTDGRNVKLEPVAITVISGWEFAALVFGRTPTVTSLVRRLPRLARRVVAVSAGVWLFRHFD